MVARKALSAAVAALLLAGATGLVTNATVLSPAHTFTYGFWVASLASLPSATKGLSLIAIGDWGSYASILRQMSKAMNQVAEQHQTQHVLAVGDNFYSAGVKSAADPKWRYLWVDVFSNGYLGGIDWYAVMGNHDWYGNQRAQLEYSKISDRWRMPDFFYDKGFSTDSAWPGSTNDVGLIFIDTNLIYYGYQGTGDRAYPGDQLLWRFQDEGWIPSSNTIEQHLQWIESKLNYYQDRKYVIVIGHHDMVTCQNVSQGMLHLQELLDKYKVSAYVFGHRHHLAYHKVRDTMYIQTGAGGQMEWNKCGLANWAQAGGHGFVHLLLKDNKIRVEYYNEYGSLLHSEEASGRF